MMTGPGASDAVITDATFYGMLGDTERSWLHDRGTARVCQPGYIMTVEGEPTENVMVVMRGLAAASCAAEDETEMPLRLYGPGDVFGGEAVSGRQARPETVRALSLCSVLVLAAGQFAELHRGTGVAQAFGVAMAHRVQEADELARNRFARPLVRLARVLLYFAARTGSGEGDIITIPVDLSQDTLATWMVVSRATAARSVAELRRRGAISTRYREITITRPAQLRKIARSQRSEPDGAAALTPAVAIRPGGARHGSREVEAARPVNRQGPARAVTAEPPRLKTSALQDRDTGDAAPSAPPGRARSGNPPAGPLTPRELEIAALVARGLSNKAIAADLVISPATAARHIANLMIKLGFRTRAQIAAWVVDRQVLRP